MVASREWDRETNDIGEWGLRDKNDNVENKLQGYIFIAQGT